MIAEKTYNKPKQKMVYSKDSSLNFGNQSNGSELFGYFKSSSALARSIRSTTGASSTLGKPLQSTGAMILNQSGRNTATNFHRPNAAMGNFTNMPSIEEEKNKTYGNGWNITSIKAETPKNQMDIKIRNITHNYSDIDVNDYSYNVLSNLKSKKRMQNLDAIEFYEIWKAKFLKEVEEQVKEKTKNLQENLENTKNEVYSRFLMKDNELIPLVQSDIDNIENFYHGVLRDRDNNINECSKNVHDDLNKCYQRANMRLNKLGDEMDKIGFLYEEQIKDVLNEKRQYVQRFYDVKKSYYTRIMNEIKGFEDEIVEKSKKDLEEFILRWKNIKLNNYVSELQKLLQSKEYSDPEERTNIVKEIKQIQEDIYNKKYNLIFTQLFSMDYDQITTKNIEKINKQLENIISEGDKLFMDCIQKLMKNSEDVQKKSLEAFEKFKADVSTISYDFTKDNHNGKRYNDYDDLNTLEELFEKEVNSVLNKNKDDRTNFIKNLNTYLEEYDDYINNVCEKIINLFLSVGKLYDEHKRDLKKAEKDYLVSYAKECDNDDNIIHDKEEELKKISEQIKNCINKEELDKGLEDSFKIIDELEVEFREFFKKIDELFNSHDGILTNEYHKYENKIFNVFGIYNEDNRYEIEKRRNKESEFLSKKKEAQIAEEERIKEEEEAKEEERTGKKKPQKKKENKPQLKKGEVPPPLVPPRQIKNFTSKLGFSYLVDFEIEELIKHLLRNIVNKRDDDIFELKPKTPEELEALAKEKEEYEQRKKEEEENKGKKGAKKEVKEPPKPAEENPEEQIDYLNAFDPYNGNHEIKFSSPLSFSNEKLLSEQNDFISENLTKGLTDLFEKINEKINSNHTSNLNDAHLRDQETREEQLSDLDIRLKSLSPRKGKIEVEEYDKRLNELDKHQKKLEKHKEDICEKNKKTDEENNNLLSKIEKDFNDLKELHEKLLKGMEEQESDKGLEEQFKKFKTSYYDFLIDLEENEAKLKEYSDDHPNELISSNKNYLLSLKPMSKGGTYSDREIEFTKGELEKLENETIKASQEERRKINDEKLKGIRDECETFMKNINDQYALSKDNIMAKDAMGKKFGVPKRLSNDIIINIKIKCNQAQEGIQKLYNDLIKYVSEFNKIKNVEELNKALKENDLPIKIRRQLQKINTCVWYYGKYINAFKDSLANSYQLTRVTMKENIEDITITEKEDIDADEALKKEEILSLGLLSKFILDTSANVNQDKKKAGAQGGEPNYNNEIASIDDKLRSECAKIYVGNYAKFLNPQEKLPDSLIPFLEEIKREMEIMRLRCVKDLRTFCQNLYQFSLEIPACVFKFIFGHSNMVCTGKTNEIMNTFNKSKENSDKVKDELKTKLGPYLANPFYSKDLSNFETKDNERNVSIIKSINETQFNLIVNEEESSKNYTTRLLNNFACLMALFDNFIFEEEFISLGDEEYFKNRQNYNQLLKLKDTLDEKINAGQEGKKNVGGKNAVDMSKYDFGAKRTFKKLFKGINFKEGKINYYDMFQKIIKEYVENSEEKIKTLENEYRKDNWSKSITGIKLQNNKNLFIERNKFYKQHCDTFNQNIKDDINKFNNLRVQELEYKFKWDEMVKDLKNTLKKFNIPEGVECEAATEESKQQQKTTTKKTSAKKGKGKK